MKKIAVLITLFVVLMTTSIGQANAPFAKAQQQISTFTFEELGYDDLLLLGPYDSGFMYFSLPPTWSLTDGGKISLTYTHLFSRGIVNNNEQWVAGSLLVFFNGELIDTVLLDSTGMSTVEIEIPARAYISETDDGRQDISFFLDARTICDYDDAQSSVFIHGISSVDFSYNVVPPSVDLNIFPRPIYQLDSLVPNQAKIVVPDEPTASELQAALSVSTGLASFSENEINLEILQEKNLTDEILNSEHLIFVGQANKFPKLFGVRMPISPSENGVVYTGIQDGDGVVQIAQSPWQPDYVIMMVTGNSDEGVVKAAQAVSTGKVVSSNWKDLSIIASTSVPTPGEPVAEDVTFAELGYETFTLGSYEGDYFVFDFYVSSEQVFSEDAYFELVATYSDLMDESRTAINVLLNETVIGNISIDEETGDVLRERIDILPNMLRRGRNVITIYSDLVPDDSCYDPNLEATWVTVSGESLLHLPISDREIGFGTKTDLADFPAIFLSDDSLADFAVILPQNDPASWNSALDITAILGATAATPIVKLEAVYADNVSEDLLKEKNLLVVGQASSLPVISEMNNFLPAPFPEGSDNAEQPSLLVNYRLMPDVNVGYLQLLPSPWNTENIVLAVMGNSSIGVPMAANALSVEALTVQLLGNFSILYGNQVLSADTRLGPARDSLMASLPEEAIIVEESTNNQTATPPEEDVVVVSKPKWLIPVVGALTLFIIILVGFVMRREAMMQMGGKEK